MSGHGIDLHAEAEVRDLGHHAAPRVAYALEHHVGGLRCGSARTGGTRSSEPGWAEKARAVRVPVIRCQKEQLEPIGQQRSATQGKAGVPLDTAYTRT